MAPCRGILRFVLVVRPPPWRWSRLKLLTVVCPCAPAEPSSPAFSCRRAGRVANLVARGIFKPTGGFRCRCPSIKNACGHGTQYYGIRGSRWNGIAWCCGNAKPRLESCASANRQPVCNACKARVRRARARLERRLPRDTVQPMSTRRVTAPGASLVMQGGENQMPG